MKNLKLRDSKKRLIIDTIDALDSLILTRTQLNNILEPNREIWKLNATISQFIDFLLSYTKLEVIEFKLPDRKILRYTWGKAPLFEIINTLKPNSYFSHYSAMFLNELTNQIPKMIYLNFEQPAKGGEEGGLEQSRIDAAFKRRPRITNYISSYNIYKIYFINGKFTKNLGVIDIKAPDGSNVKSTNIERTLIDIVVRPAYSGGIFEILRAYELARERVSIKKLSSMLKKLNYIYPYHQAIGFYLEKAGGYKENEIKILREFKMKYDFYLTYEMKKMEYSKKWRLFFPKGF